MVAHRRRLRPCCCSSAGPCGRGRRRPCSESSCLCWPPSTSSSCASQTTGGSGCCSCAGAWRPSGPSRGHAVSARPFGQIPPWWWLLAGLCSRCLVPDAGPPVQPRPSAGAPAHGAELRPSAAAFSQAGRPCGTRRGRDCRAGGKSRDLALAAAAARRVRGAGRRHSKLRRRHRVGAVQRRHQRREDLRGAVAGGDSGQRSSVATVDSDQHRSR